MTFAVAAGLSSVSHAQQSTTALTGEWVGNIDSPVGQSFARLSLTENAGEMRRPRNGDYLVIDSSADTPDTLFVTDVKSGEARAVFPRSETQVTGGPALYVASPTRQTLTVRGAGVHVINLDRKGRTKSYSLVPDFPKSLSKLR